MSEIMIFHILLFASISTIFLGLLACLIGDLFHAGRKIKGTKSAQAWIDFWAFIDKTRKRIYITSTGFWSFLVAALICGALL